METKYNIPPEKNWFYVFVSAILVFFGKIYFRLEVKGLENIPATGAVIVAPAHRSNLDPPAVGIMSSRQLHFMAKHTLFSVPILGAAIRKLNAFPVKRGAFDRTAMEYSFELLRQGRPLLIFPEGTRSRDGLLQKPLAGVGMMVAKAKVPVVPCYIHGSYEAYPRKMKFPLPHKVTVIFGEKIDYSVLLKDETINKETYERIANEIMEHIRKLIPAQ